jgi:hypothetical protein
MPDAPPKPVDQNARMPMLVRHVIQVQQFCQRSGIPEGAALSEMLNAQYDLWQAQEELVVARRPAGKPAPAAAADTPAAEGDPPAPAAPVRLSREQRRRLAHAIASGKVKVNGAHPDVGPPATAPAAD